MSLAPFTSEVLSLYESSILSQLMASEKVGMFHRLWSVVQSQQHHPLWVQNGTAKEENPQKIFIICFDAFSTIYFLVSFHWPHRLTHRISLSFLLSTLFAGSPLKCHQNLEYLGFCYYYYCFGFKELCLLGNFAYKHKHSPENTMKYLAPL